MEADAAASESKQADTAGEVELEELDLHALGVDEAVADSVQIQRAQATARTTAAWLLGG